jgi:hypothetical protein
MAPIGHRAVVLWVVLSSACGGQITGTGGPGPADAPIVSGAIDAPIIVAMVDATSPPPPDARPPGNGCVPPLALVLAPAPVTQTVTPGTPFSQTFTATAHYAGAPAVDVTAQTFFAASDATVATFAGSKLSWAGAPA